MKRDKEMTNGTNKISIQNLNRQIRTPGMNIFVLVLLLVNLSATVSFRIGGKIILQPKMKQITPLLKVPTVDHKPNNIQMVIY